MKRFLVKFSHKHGLFGDIIVDDETIISASNENMAITHLFTHYGKIFWISDFSVLELNESEYIEYCKNNNYDKYVSP